MSSFSKQAVTFFEKLCKGFDDKLIISGLAEVVNTDQVQMQRANDTFWRPLPYIGQSFAGSDATANFGSYTQMSVPASINTRRHAPFQMTDLELRDSMQESRLVESMSNKLASDINFDLLSIVSNRGTLFVKRSAACSGFEDIQQIDALYNEQGIPYEDRNVALSSRDYNSAANDLSKASRSLDNEISTSALRRAVVGEIANIKTWKLDYAISKAAALGGGALTASTIYTAGGTGNYALPTATDASGGNVDNRVQNMTLSATTNVAAGDTFTIAGVFAVHRITKRSTGILKTFKVIAVSSGTVLQVSPQMVNVEGTSLAEKAYGNVVITAQSGTAAVVFQNTVLGSVNPFWVKGAVEIYPGRIAAPADAGVQVMQSVTKSGFQLVMMKFFDINTGTYKVRVDTLYGVGVPLPEHCGSIMFSQT